MKINGHLQTWGKSDHISEEIPGGGVENRLEVAKSRSNVMRYAYGAGLEDKGKGLS